MNRDLDNLEPERNLGRGEHFSLFSQNIKPTLAALRSSLTAATILAKQNRGSQCSQLRVSMAEGGGGGGSPGRTVARRVLRISSDGDDRRMFLGLGRKIWQAFFCVA